MLSVITSLWTRPSRMQQSREDGFACPERIAKYAVFVHDWLDCERDVREWLLRKRRAGFRRGRVPQGVERDPPVPPLPIPNPLIP